MDSNDESKSSQNPGKLSIKETKIEEDLPMQIDSVSWSTKHDSLLAIGAYQLDTVDTSVRRGRIYLINLTPKVPGGFEMITEYETNGGVLDLKFLNDEDFEDFLAVACSSGLYIFKLEKTYSETMLKLVSSIETTAMALYLQWINSDNIIFSDSEGAVNLVEKQNGQFRLSRRKKLHDNLTWVVHYSKDQDVVYAGADDGKFSAFELSEIMREEVHFTKTFRVGVVSVSTKEDLIIIGSYDDTLYFAQLIAKSPKPQLSPILSINIGGAPWRTMFLPSLTSMDNNVVVIAIAGARKGIQIIEYDPEVRKAKCVYACMKYEGSLAYGLDVKVDFVKFRYLIASGYFDNKMLHCFEVGQF